MKVLSSSNTAIRFLSIPTALLLGLVLAGSASAQGYTSRVVDLQSCLSQDILSLLVQQCPRFQTPDLERITKDVQISATAYNLEPGFVLAMMVADQEYSSDSLARYPQARLYYFNLDMAAYNNQGVFPIAWFDAERVARAYTAEYQRYNSREKAIAAYFVGHHALASDFEVAELPQALRDLVTEVLNKTAEWSHLGERIAPQVVETSAQTPQTSFEQPQYDLTEIEERYVQNMMVFNPRLDSATAHEIFEAIRKNAEDYQDVDARLVMALVACESSFRPNAVSHCGAQGLGQLMPFTSDNFGVLDPFDVNENIRGTFAYLQREIERWSGSNYPLDRVLAAYNAGPGAVEQYSDPPYNGIPPYDETVNYVARVVNIYFYLLPEEERAERLSGKSRHIAEANGTVYLAS
jgi:soluble lytic murein transglycosylase-like protein